jgi:antitoxin HicB
MIRTYVYRAVLEVGENPDVLVVSFPDVPEAITQGKGRADALAEAADALGLVLLEYLRRGRPLPQAKSRKGVPVSVDAQDAAKLAVLEAFAASGITKTELARRLGIRESEARRILDPMHPTKLPRLSEALAALGLRLVIGVEEIAA